MNESLWKIVKALRTARAAHGIMLMTDPTQDAWKAWGVSNELIEAEQLCMELLAYTQPYQPIYSPPLAEKADAKRYRWLAIGGFDKLPYTDNWVSKEWLDEMIDKEMKEENI